MTSPVRFFLATCALAQSGQAQAVAAQIAPQSRMVQVDGRAMRVRTAGIEQRQPGSPIIVLEAGALGGIESWNPVFAGVAGIAPVIAYDRRGLGKSESDDERPTPEHVATTLAALLRTLGAAPPYILAGHSWGGPLIRMFAARFPNDIAGMVYLDASDWESTRADALAAVMKAGGSEAELALLEAARHASMSNLPPNAPPGARAEVRVVQELDSSGQLTSGFAALPQLPSVPVAVVIAAGKARRVPPRPPGLPLPASFDLATLTRALV